MTLKLKYSKLVFNKKQINKILIGMQQIFEKHSQKLQLIKQKNFKENKPITKAKVNETSDKTSKKILNPSVQLTFDQKLLKSD